MHSHTHKHTDRNHNFLINFVIHFFSFLSIHTFQNKADKYDSSYYNKLFSKRPDEDREKLTINCSLTMIPAICTCSGMGIFCVNRNLHDVPRKDLPKKMNVL